MTKKPQSPAARIETIESLILMSASAMEIEGTDAGEWIQGTSGDDIINAGGGDDEIYSPEGNNWIDGGHGMDSFIVYEGVRDDYTMTTAADGSCIIEGPGLNGVTNSNVLMNVEKIVFNDGWILVDSAKPDDVDGGGDDPDDVDEDVSGSDGSNKSGKDESGKSGSNKSGKSGSNKSGSNKSNKDDSGKSGSNKSNKDDSGKSGSNKSNKDDSGKSDSNKSDNSGSNKSGSNRPVADPPSVDPVAVKDMAYTTEGTAVWGNVLENDLGLSDEVTVELLSGPEHGHLMLNEDGSFDYVPFDGFVGKDVFQYNVINDSGKSSVGELCIFIEDDGGDGDDEPSGSNKSGKDDSGKSGSNKSGKSGAKKLGKNGKRKH